MEEAKDGNSVRGGVNAGIEFVVEGQRVFRVRACHVDVESAERWGGGNFGEREVVSGESSDGAVADESRDYRSGSSAAVKGVGPAEDFVDEEKNRLSYFRDHGGGCGGSDSEL